MASTISSAKGVVIASVFFVGLGVGAYLWHRFHTQVFAGLKFWFSSRGGVPHSERAEMAELTRELSALNAEIERLSREPPLAQTNFAAQGEGGVDDNVSMHNFVAEPSLWDRVEFLSRCGHSVTLMSRILDEQLCDHFTGPRSGYRLARALRALLLSAEACADAGPARAAASAFCDGERWKALARERVVPPWLAALSHGAEPLCAADDAASLSAPSVVEALEELAGLHAQLSAWPAVTDANLMWSLAEKSSEPPTVDFGAGSDDAFTPFSPSGRVLRAGDAVFVTGPSLLVRESKAGGPSLSDEQLAELRGKRCLTLVIDGSQS